MGALISGKRRLELSDMQARAARAATGLQSLGIVAGERGSATVTWPGAGFTYTLVVTRGTPTTPAVTIDGDPAADPAVIDRIREALYPNP